MSAKIIKEHFFETLSFIIISSLPNRVKTAKVFILKERYVFIFLEFFKFYYRLLEISTAYPQSKKQSLLALSYILYLLKNHI